MKRINELDIETSNKIAAGEVVERPFSVVKELVENSIDAESRNISIDIIDGGQKLIKVFDDGTGIHPDDIKRAFLPHATSKIQRIEDVFNISTLGFRGEALASIASISHVMLKSKMREYEIGKEILIEGGIINHESPTACNNGTLIEVRDIFYNVPARLKFMKTPQREAALISDITSRLALANPGITFKLNSNGKNTLTTYATNNPADTIRGIYGKSISDNIISFENHTDICSVYGFIGNAEVSRGSRTHQTILVNKRYIKSKLITTAVENAFKSFLTINKFPFFVLYIDIYPELLDVNIHPTKSEIKFKNDREVFKAVFDAVHAALRKSLVSTFDIPTDRGYEQNTELSVIQLPLDFITPSNADKSNGNFMSSGGSLNTSDSFITQDLSLNTISNIMDSSKAYGDHTRQLNNAFMNLNNASTDDSLTDGNSSYDANIGRIPNQFDHVVDVGLMNQSAKFPALRIIGQLFNTYILAEGPEGLYAIDQHAAHEKILFEKYTKEIKKQEVVSQLLAFPVVVELTSEDFEIYSENSEVFSTTGFNIDVFGENTINIKEVPIFLGKPLIKAFFIETLDNLKSMGSGTKTEVKYSSIARMACMAAIKANDSISDMEMRSLVEELRYIDDPFNCPHGRPTIIKITMNEFEKRFKRIQ